jgi:hypothetical protein
MSLYEASGGLSRLFTAYDQHLRVEAHPDDFAVLWSSSLSAEVAFQRLVNSLPDRGEALLRHGEQVIEMDASDAVRRITYGEPWDFIRFDYRDRVLTWEAVSEPASPSVSAEVGILVEGVDEMYFLDLIYETATPDIADHAEALLSEAADVTARFPTVSLRPTMDAGA